MPVSPTATAASIAARHSDRRHAHSTASRTHSSPAVLTAAAVVADVAVPRKRRFDAGDEVRFAVAHASDDDNNKDLDSYAAGINAQHYESDAPVLTMWSNAAAGAVTRTTNGFAGFGSSSSMPTTSSTSTLASSMSNKTPRDPDHDAAASNSTGANGASAHKRLRASPFAPVALNNSATTATWRRDALPFMRASNGNGGSFATTSSNAWDNSGLFGADAVTPEEQFEALKEGSQTLMEVLSISQQNTQECTQTLEESPNMCVMRLVLHPEVDRVITAAQKHDLERHDLYRIELHRQHSRVALGRDSFVKVFDKTTSGIDPLKLSRVHCIVECVSEPNSHEVGVYITDKSTNGTRIDGIALTKDKRYKLVDGQKITLLSSRQGSVLLGYVVEDPHVRGAQVASGATGSSDSRTNALPYTYRSSSHASQSSQQPLTQQGRDFQEFTLGVLFASPLVGKDIQGKYHPIAELDVKREYSILKQSLVEASKYAKRSVSAAVSISDDAAARAAHPPMMPSSIGSSAPAPPVNTTLYEYPRPITVCAKFANTENFRTMVTIGCRALHFSGHGDERHLYFEDGMGLVHPIPHNALQELFSAGSSSTGNGTESPLRLAFVSACSSAPLAYAFVACGIPHVIGVRTNQKIEDYAAIEFTRSFYLALATGKSVGASFTIAQQAVAKSPNIRGPMEVAEKFLLLPEGGDHTEIIFPLATGTGNELAPVTLKRYPKLWFDDLPAICQGFCNRAVEVYKICLALLLTQTRITRLVTICGEEGIGKTAVAHAVANYVGPRITAEGGVRIFSVAKLAQDEQDAHVGMARRHIALSAMPKCRVLVQLQASVHAFLASQRTRARDGSALQLLLVLDGCDYLLRSDVRRERFRAFLSDILTDTASLKIVLTARTSISTDGAVPGHGERVYALSRFSAKMSAKMLLSLVSRPIRVDELKRARVLAGATATTTTTAPPDKLELIASHPALLATLGIPKRIADLAGRLNEVLMDAIPCDDSSGSGAEMVME